MMDRELVVDRASVDRSGRRVLAEVSLTLAPGDVVTVVGPNGAGKSSLLEAVLGFLPLASGAVTFGGQPLRDLRARSRVFSYMPDDAEPPPEVRVETVLAYARRFGKPRPGVADALAERLDVIRLARERVGRLSRGQKRRVALFSALCTSRPVVALDEPLATFDPLQLLEVLPVIRELAAAGTALLLTVHQMVDAERLAGRVLVLDAGAVIAFGTLGALRAQIERPEASLEEVVLQLLRSREPDARP